LRAACTTTTLRGNHVLSPTPAWHSQGGGGLSPQAPRALCGAEREARLPVSSCRMLCKEAGACWQAKKTQWPCARATLLAGWCASASRSRRALQSAEAKLPAPQVILLRRASCMSRRLSYPRCSFALSPRPPRLQQRRQRAHQRLRTRGAWERSSGTWRTKSRLSVRPTPALLLLQHRCATPARQTCRATRVAVLGAESFLVMEEQREAPCGCMADGAYAQELQSPTKQEVAEILDAELSPRSRQADGAGAHEDRRMVETETMRDTLDDGYRRAPPAWSPSPRKASHAHGARGAGS